MMQQFHFRLYTQKNWKQGLRYLYTSVHNSIIHYNQKMEIAQISVNRRMKEQNVVSTCNDILFSLKK